MESHDLKIVDGAVAGAWIKPRLEGEFGAVTLQVPKGFGAYARIFHPASDSEGNSVSWAEVAKTYGTIAHREMQWHAILRQAAADELAGANDSDGSKWAGTDPSLGPMDIETLDALCEILAVHAADLTHCFFGLCTIHGWLDSFSADELKPLLELPDGRNHVVLAGPLSAIDQIAFDWSRPASLRVTFGVRTNEGLPPESDASEWVRREAPNLIWPADHSWLIASDVDFDSTLVGGSTELIDAIIESPELEVWQVGPADSLAVDADKVNISGERPGS